jgi:hypothetical protein
LDKQLTNDQKRREAEYHVRKILEGEQNRLLKPGIAEEMLDAPEIIQNHPYLRAELLRGLKELGRMPPEKE